MAAKKTRAEVPIREQLTGLTPVRFIVVLLAMVFVIEGGIMFVLPMMVSPYASKGVNAGLDALLLVAILAPILWSMVIGPLQSVIVTEQRQALGFVQVAAQYRLLFDENPLPMWVVAADTSRFLAVNDAAVRHYGYSRDEFLKMTAFDLRPAEAFPRLREQMSTLRAEPNFRALGTWRHLKKDGTPIDVEVTIHSIEFAQRAANLVLIQDVTERRRAEESEARLVAILESTPDLVSIADLEGRLVYMNRAGRTMLGIDERADLTRYNLREFHDAANARVVLTEGIPTAMRDGAWSGETVLTRLDGRAIPVSHVILAHRPPSGESTFLSTIARDITERKRAEEALRTDAHRLSSIYETVGDVIFHLEVEAEGRYRFVSVNPSFCRVTGLSQEQVVGKTVTELIPEPSGTMVLGKYRQAIEAKTIVRWEEVSDYPTGRLTGEVSVAPVFDDKGKCTHLVGSVHDITGRKRAEEELLHLKLAVDASDEVIFMTDREGTITSINPAFTRLYGYTTDEVVGKATPRILKSGVQKAEIYEGFWRALLDRRIVKGDLVNKTKDGRLLCIDSSANPILDGGGSVIGFLAVQRDITERKRAEEELGRARDRTELILNAAGEGVYGVDLEGRVTFINPKAALLLGYEQEELLHQVQHAVMHHTRPDGTPYPVEECPIYAAFRDGHSRSVSNEVFWRKDGTSFPVEYTSTPAIDLDKRPTGAVVVFRDISERRKLEAQFLQAQKMESVGRLASGIAHDFNNLLTVINGMSDLVLAQVSQDDPIHADLQEICRAGERAATLTQQLLAFSRQQILVPRVMNLNTVVSGMEELLRRLLGEDIDLVAVPTPGLGNIKADPGQLEQVITNLAVNARDAMPEGGQLTIETQNITIDEDDARQHSVAVPPGSYVQMTVSDSGVGMDEATCARIFEPFFTTKGAGKGTGLGLSTVYGLVKQSGGFIWVYSQVSRGTSFKMWLPRVTEAAGTDRPTPTAVSKPGTETLLLVEDNAGLRRLATRILAPAGYTVLEAATGAEALRRLESYDAPVHLLLSDVVMPGMSGRQLAEQVVQAHPETRVLYMSGYTSDTVVRHGVLDAQMPFLNKPFTAAALLRKVREVLDS